jgi:hypothetical protein
MYGACLSRITLQHRLQFLAPHRPTGPVAPLLLGTRDELGAEALVEMSLPIGRVDRCLGRLTFIGYMAPPPPLSALRGAPRVDRR